MTARPLVGVYGLTGPTDQQLALPGVFLAPIRLDVVSDVHTRMSRNKRQPYAVNVMAGHQTSAESWGTGRAVARIPRVGGGGTHRSGQGAFGNMCRKGRMFAPTKTYRRWHRKINKNERRYALTSALAASAITSLVMARGHRISKAYEIPLVVDSKVAASIDKTAAAKKLFETLGAFGDVARVARTKKLRAGKGKSRNRRYVLRKGPLVIYNEATPLVRAVRNLPGVDICNVNRLNLLQLAPGGHLGRFCIWTSDAFTALDALYGSNTSPSSVKVGYQLPRSLLSNGDVSRIINSDEVQSALKARQPRTRAAPKKHNPLTNGAALAAINPFGKAQKRAAFATAKKRLAAKAALLEAKKAGKLSDAQKKTIEAAKTHAKKVKKANSAFVKSLLA